MKIVEHLLQGAILLELCGGLNFSSRKKFMDAIHQATGSDQVHVIFDLQGITYADESAINLLVIAHQKLTQHHRRLSLLNPPEQLARILHSMNFPRIFPIYTSLEEALKRNIGPFSLVN